MTRAPVHARVLLFVVLALLATQAPALAETRVALVIGNSAYKNASPLANPANDARLMAESLKRLGFELVDGKALTDLPDKAAMEQAVQRFGERIRKADVALFFYAGHGVQVDGANYLVPVGANVSGKSQVKYQLVDADYVMQEMAEAGTRVNLVVLDACRNNPFGERGLRAANGGLAQVNAPRGTLVAYSTAPGRTAADGAGANSPFSAALARYMQDPGLRIEDVFMRVGADVERQTGGEQSPWKSDNLRGVFCLCVPCGTGVPGPQPTPQAAPQAAPAAPTPRTALYPPPAGDATVKPGDPDWDTGPVQLRRASYLVAVDQGARTPKGNPTFRLDFDNQQSLVDYFPRLESMERRDLSGFRGMEFSVRGSRPVVVYATIVTSIPGGGRVADRFYFTTRATQQWQTIQVNFRSMRPSVPWRARIAAYYGYTPGDGLLRPEFTENLRIGMAGDINEPGPGSLWIGDIRFYK